MKESTKTEIAIVGVWISLIIYGIWIVKIMFL